jgi:hypothetical protein
MARRIELSAQTWHALDDLSQETGRHLNDLAEEAFADLIKKRRRPRSLRDALRTATECRQPMSLREALRTATQRYVIRDEGPRLRNRR